eukprot:TRINITY_DN1180_c1_g1_i8.p1 TRINITY_DN1180_c1_g1~~TRINITY_DN1180_c1_g1_i8.p1  ORF type:complete len:447 (+),score=109.47 TRINITY_DN1180_c1_g1_i8:220-1560(+)
MFAYNRARQRRKLAHLFVEWGGILAEAEKLDNLIRTQKQAKKQHEEEFFSFWVSSWVIGQCFPLMSQFLLLGFELEIYNPVEYPMVFWYLEFLLSTETKHHVQIIAATKRVTGYSTTHAYKARGQRTKGKTPGAGKKEPEQVAEKECVKAAKEEVQTMPVATRILFIKYRMSGAFFRYIVAAHVHAGKLHTTDNAHYGGIEARFINRFGVFHRLPQPQPLFPQHYTSTVDLCKTPAIRLYEEALDMFEMAHAGLVLTLDPSPLAPPSPQVAADLRRMLDVVTANMAQISAVVTELTLRGGDAAPVDPHRTLQYDWKSATHGHPFWPVVSLTSTTTPAAAKTKTKTTSAPPSAPNKQQQPQQQQPGKKAAQPQQTQHQQPQKQQQQQGKAKQAQQKPQQPQTAQIRTEAGAASATTSAPPATAPAPSTTTAPAATVPTPTADPTTSS